MATKIKLKQLEDGTTGQLIVVNGVNVPSYVNQNLINLSGFNNDLPSGLTIGTTTITSGTNTRILYNNAGVIGEYLVTGTGTTAVLSTSPTFTTDITTPKIIGNGSTNSLLVTGSTTAVANNATGVHFQPTLVATANFDNLYGMLIAPSYTSGAFTSLRKYGLSIAGSAERAIFIQNYGTWLYKDTNQQIKNDYLSNGNLAIYSNNIFAIDIFGEMYRATGLGTSGAITNHLFTTLASTNQTLSTNIPNFKVTGSTKQWATGPLATQYFNYFSANTVSFVGASTATIAANFVADYVQGGTNATITTSSAIYVPTVALTNTTTSYGIYANAASGAKNNFAIGALGAIHVSMDTAIGKFQSRVGGTANFAIYNVAVPDANNFSFSSDGSSATILNNAGSLAFRIGNVDKIGVSTGNITFTPATLNGTSFNFTIPTGATNMTASTERIGLLVSGGSKSWVAGTLALQRNISFSSPTVAFASASNATLAANLSVDYVQGGTNATVTTSAAIYVPTLALTNTTTGIGLFVNAPSGAGTNYAARFNGVTDFLGNVRLTQTVTTEVVVSDTTVTVVINGTTYKLLAKA